MSTDANESDTSTANLDPWVATPVAQLFRWDKFVDILTPHGNHSPVVCRIQNFPLKNAGFHHI